MSLMAPLLKLVVFGELTVIFAGEHLPAPVFLSFGWR
jgi:hypothetical protein